MERSRVYGSRVCEGWGFRALGSWGIRALIRVLGLGSWGLSFTCFGFRVILVDPPCCAKRTVIVYRYIYIHTL